jgi:hypothetical protein
MRPDWKAPRATHEAPTSTHLTKGPGHNTPCPYVWASAAYPPAPGRRLWHYAVDCLGGHVHLHRGAAPAPAGHLRTAPCGHTYRILAAATERIPESRAATE